MTAQDCLARIRHAQVPAYGDDEVLFMAGTALELRPDAVYDWGTNVGASARVFWEVAQQGGYLCQVHSTELPEGSEHREKPTAAIYAELVRHLPVELHLGDGAEVSVALCLEARPERPLFFVDGDHEAFNVYRELRLIYENVPHAWCLVHDTQGSSGEGVAGFVGSWPWPFFVDFLPSQAGMTRLKPGPQAPA